VPSTVTLTANGSRPWASVTPARKYARGAQHLLPEGAAGRVRLVDHAGVEAGAGHDGEGAIVAPSGVEHQARTGHHRPHDVGRTGRQTETAREQVGRPGGQHGQRDSGIGECFGGGPHSPVAPADHDRLHAGGHQLGNGRPGLPSLGDTDPHRFQIRPGDGLA
jgi:hypothetical protein